MAPDFLLDVQFEDREPAVDGEGIGRAAVEKFAAHIEAIAEAVRRVDAHDERAVAQFGEADASRGGEAGFSDSAFAAEE